MAWLKTLRETKSVQLPSGRHVSLLKFQERVRLWAKAVFGENFADDEEERDDRFIEECIELYQAKGRPLSRLWTMAQYVYSRPKGDPHQEFGGVMTTFAAMCCASNEDMEKAGNDELARIWTKKEAIHAKFLTKPKFSPLPGQYPGEGLSENNWEPTELQVNSACVSFRHDFGLLSAEEQGRVRFQAREWLRCWLREMPKSPVLQMMPKDRVNKAA